MPQTMTEQAKHTAGPKTRRIASGLYEVRHASVTYRLRRMFDGNFDAWDVMVDGVSVGVEARKREALRLIEMDFYRDEPAVLHARAATARAEGR